MGYMYYRNSQCMNCAYERRQPNLQAIADDCQQRILFGMQQCLDADRLGIFVCDVHLVLAFAQAMMDIYDRIKNPDKRGKITNLNDPFRRLDELHALVENLKQVMEELRKRRREIEESLPLTKWKRNACNAVFTVITIGMIGGSVALVALVAVPVAATSGTAAGALVKAVEQWISLVWEQRKDALKKKQKLVEKMQATLQVLASYGHLEDLLSVIGKVKSNYAALVVDMEDVDANDDNEATAENKIKEMKTKMNELTACMDLLIIRADKCTKKIRRAQLELSLIINN